MYNSNATVQKKQRFTSISIINVLLYPVSMYWVEQYISNPRCSVFWHHRCGTACSVGGNPLPFSLCRSFCRLMEYSLTFYVYLGYMRGLDICPSVPAPAFPSLGYYVNLHGIECMLSSGASIPRQWWRYLAPFSLFFLLLYPPYALPLFNGDPVVSPRGKF